MVAMTLAFAGCEDDFGSEHDRGNDGGGSGGGAATGTINGHDYVDLGLPSGTKWATCNVGANSPEGYGNYYAWGETTTKSSYDYSNSVTYWQQISDFSGNPTYDAARANWGGTWRMPTKAEMEELINKCNWTWTTQNGENGYKVTGPNGKSIFLPAASGFRGSLLYDVGEYGLYWSSTPYESLTDYACGLDFYSGYHNVYWGNRYDGHTVRPVSGTINYGTTDTEELPTVTTNSVTSITKNSAQCGGNVTSDGVATVTQRGVCWATYQNPTIYDNTTYDGEGTGVFTSHITNLSPGTTYYVRAYATNSEGTAYGAQRSFTTQSSTNPGITVTFGTDTWTAGDMLAGYLQEYNAVLLYAYSDENGNYPIMEIESYAPTSLIGSINSGEYDPTTDEYAGGELMKFHYYHENMLYVDQNGSGAYEQGEPTYGDYWAKNATITISALDLTAMTMTATGSAVMFEALPVLQGQVTLGASNRVGLSFNANAIDIQVAKGGALKKAAKPENLSVARR